MNTLFFATCSAHGKAWYESAETVEKLAAICKELHPSTNVTITDPAGEFVAYIHHTNNV